MAISNKLTDLKIRQVIPSKKVSKLSDGRGMYLLLHPNGSKYWRMDFRHQGKQKTLALGIWPEVSLREAREKRDKAKLEIQSGINPIFQELTLNYLEVWGQNWENRAPLRLRLFKQLDLTRTKNVSQNTPAKHPSRERIVILSQVLPDVVNIGYQELRNMVVKKVNGKRVVNLESMVEALQNPQTGFHRVEFLPGSERVQIVLPVQELVSADERIMKNFQIPRLQSL